MHIIQRVSLTLLFLTSLLFSTVPGLLSYQGVLTDTEGNPVADGDYPIRFTIYNGEEADAPQLWTSLKSISVKEGYFSTMLGSDEPLKMDFSGVYTLGITVGNEAELSPRVTIASSAFAIRAALADSAMTISDGAVGNKSLAADAVTTDKIADGTITSADVATDFKAPLSGNADSATVAASALTATLANSVAANTINSASINDGTITSADVATDFKAPLSGNADSATVAASAKIAALANSVAANAINSANIIDGTITSADVVADFKAPLSGVADTARTANKLNFKNKTSSTSGNFSEVKHNSSSEIEFHFGSWSGINGGSSMSTKVNSKGVETKFIKTDLLDWGDDTGCKEASDLGRMAVFTKRESGWNHTVLGLCVRTNSPGGSTYTWEYINTDGKIE